MTDPQSSIEREVLGPSKSKLTLLFSHGAGAGNRHPFMQAFANYFAGKGIRVVNINFPYMQECYTLNKKRPPNQAPILLRHLKGEINREHEVNSDLEHLVLVGKSMGGRIATMLMSEADFLQTQKQVSAVVVLGYPFIPPGKPEKLASRVEHLKGLSKPCLILQGERDSFGNRILLESDKFIERYLHQNTRISWVHDGDHSFKPRKSSGFTEEQNFSTSMNEIEQFIQTL